MNWSAVRGVREVSFGMEEVGLAIHLRIRMRILMRMWVG